MEWISTSEMLPNDSKFRNVICDDGMNIAYYDKIKESWIDREGWHINVVLSYQLLPEPPKEN